MKEFYFNQLFTSLSPEKIKEQMNREYARFYETAMEAVLGRAPSEEERKLFQFKPDKKSLGSVAIFFNGVKKGVLTQRIESSIREGEKITFSWQMSKET